MRLAGWIPLALTMAATSAGAQAARVPAELQFALLAKIMTFDRTFTPHDRSEIVIGIVYQKRLALSREAAEDLAQAIAHSDVKLINGARVRVTQIELESLGSLQNALRDKGVDIAYIMPLRDSDVKDMLDAVRGVHARSFTGVPEYVSLGICAGIGIRHSVPEIIINLTAARAAGQDFSAELLKLSRVVV